jgi:aerobic-type carbon monoxide dehydrogenase small subunit (CoxS/CutS family)
VSSEKNDDSKKVSRRNFLKGAGAGAVVGAVAVAGIEEGIRLPGMQVLPTQTVSALTASLTASPTSVQVGSSVTFSATPGGGTSPYTISINCGDGASLTASGSHTYSSSGQFEALLTITDSAGMKAYAIAAVSVGAPPAYGQMITLNVNGADFQVATDYRWTLLDVLRDKLYLTGTKKMCDRGECGSCTVLIGGKPMLSCMMLAVEAQGQPIITIEGLRTSLNRAGTALHYIQQAFVDNDATQCGVCTPGLILTSKALLDVNPNPTADQVKQALAGNICRCGCYPEILQAVLAAAKVGK